MKTITLILTSFIAGGLTIIVWVRRMFKTMEGQL